MREIVCELRRWTQLMHVDDDGTTMWKNTSIDVQLYSKCSIHGCCLQNGNPGADYVRISASSCLDGVFRLSQTEFTVPNP